MSDGTSVELATNPEWLDPEEFPFTSAELLKACRLWISEDEARELVELMREVSRLNNDHRAEQARKYPETRSMTPRIELATLKHGDYMKIEWLWPTLSVLSSSSSARANEWMRDHWRRQFILMLLSARRDAAEAAGLIPPDMQRHDPRVPLPAVTDDMRDTVTYLIEQQRFAWDELALEAKRRLDAQDLATDSPPATPPRP